MEIWKKINGFNDKYEVSNFGNIKSNFYGKFKLLKCTKHKQNGYHYIQLMDNGLKKTFRVHKLVIETFIGTKEGVINHIDLNKSNNHLSNLEWVSIRENKCHSVLSSKSPGVSFNSKTEKYRARIFYNGKSIHLGCFENKLVAELAIVDFENNNKIVNKYRSKVFE